MALRVKRRERQEDRERAEAAVGEFEAVGGRGRVRCCQTEASVPGETHTRDSLYRATCHAS